MSPPTVDHGHKRTYVQTMLTNKDPMCLKPGIVQEVGTHAEIIQLESEKLGYLAARGR